MSVETVSATPVSVDFRVGGSLTCTATREAVRGALMEAAQKGSARLCDHRLSIENVARLVAAMDEARLQEDHDIRREKRAERAHDFDSNWE